MKITAEKKRLLLSKAAATMQRNMGFTPSAQFNMQPVSQDVRVVDPVLTNLSIGYMNDNLIWDQVAPVTPSEASGTFFIYTRDFWFRTFDQGGGLIAGEASEYKRAGYGLATDTFVTIERGIEKASSRSTIAKAQTPESIIDTDVAFITNIIANNYERLVAFTIFKNGVWGTSSTPGNKWDDDVNGTPISDVLTGRQTIRKGTGQNPNLIVFGTEAFDSISEHADLLEKYKFTQPAGGVISPELVAQALRVERILIGDSVYNTAKEGADFVGTDIWGDNALLLIQEGSGLRVPSAVQTMVWDEDGQGAIPWALNQFVTPNQRANVVQGFWHSVVKVTSTVSGYFLNNVST